jgi:hypothetical protein
MVNSEMIISEKAEKVLSYQESSNMLKYAHLKTPYRSALKAPKPAAAEKFPRSMIPLETKTLLFSAEIRTEYPNYSLRVGLMDDAQSGGSLQVRVDDHDLALVLLLASLIQNGSDGLSELDSACSSVLGTSDQLLRVLGRLDGSKDVGALRVPLVEVCNCWLTV